ncbi:MAG: aspartyl-tRNA(Asn)/glutamyl-tRNA(Gln) amidotransferase subunit A [Alphaproteobacteria bacterium]|jgi:aspartyl-tRNA(Asn)/glutamyl-tRNA(Gln) amidotransferase subunit A
MIVAGHLGEDICFLTITDAGRRFRDGTLTPTQLTEALLNRIERLNGRLNAYLLVTADQALAAAAAATKAFAEDPALGAMHGIPVAFKDNIETAGIRTTAQSRVLLDHIPEQDAEVVRRLKAAGAVILGKLACLEFAHGAPSPDQAFPPARNPWNTDHGFTGGSSTGSAVAVAAGLATCALGSDTGGSIRNPAAMCATAGLMPTYGRVSRRGIIPYSFSLDHCGPLAWTAQDCALALQALAGFDAADPGSADNTVPDFTTGIEAPITGLRIGVLRHFFERDAEADPEMITSFDAALDVFKSLGAEIVETEIEPLSTYHDAKAVIGEAEFFAAHGDDWLAHANDFGASLRSRILEGALIPASDYLTAQRARRHLIARMDAKFKNFDALMTLSVPQPAPPFPTDGGTAQARPGARRPNFNEPFNVTAVPALSVCMGFSGAGLPFGLQIIGRAFDEAKILRIGHAFEQATPYRERRPDL